MGKRDRGVAATDPTAQSAQQVRQSALRRQGVLQLDPAADEPERGGEAPGGAPPLLGGVSGRHRGQSSAARDGQSREGRPRDVPSAEEVLVAAASAESRDHEVEQRGGSSADEQELGREGRVVVGDAASESQRLGLERGPILEELRVREPVVDTAFKLGQRRAFLDARQLRLVRLLARQLHVQRALPLGLLDSGRERELQRSRVRADLRPVLHKESRLRLLLARGLVRAFLRADVRPLLRGALLRPVLHP